MNENRDTSVLELLDCASLGRPCIGERVSGDNALIEERNGFVFLAIIDVLGHGPNAHLLSLEIEKFLQENWTNNVTETLLKLHENFKGTLGAAAGLAVLEVETGELSYCGVGNTAIRVLGQRSRRLVSTDGVLGSRMRTPLEQKLFLNASDVLLLYTDGIKDRFELSDYPQIVSESSSSIARNIVRRFEKVYDDATCIVLRYKK
jgi:serine phosphatase RsbU (regulator of sigma subunit)